MVATSQRARIDAGALSVAGLQRLIDRLPAETRARMAWSPNEIRAALSSFVTGSKDEAALHELVAVLMNQFRVVSTAIVPFASHPDLLRSELEEAWRADATALRERIPMPAADAADWVFRAWGAFMDLSLAIMHSARAELPGMISGADDEILYHPGSPLRAQALMMSATEAARHGSSEEVVSDLVFRAFDETVLMLEQLKNLGIHLDPYRGETLAERGKRLSRYADYLRDELSESDMRELERSRMRTLR